MAKNYDPDVDTTITMESAIIHLGLQHEFPIVAGNKYYTCPFCGKKKKFNIDFSQGLYKCWSCAPDGKGPGAGNAIKFWAQLRGFGDDLSAAGKDYAKMMYDMHSSGNVVKIELPKAPKIKEFELASIHERHLAYSKLLEMLSLAEVHKTNLLNRGLSEDMIVRGGYKSAPEAATAAICHALMSEGIALEGVPGFFKSDGDWRFVNYGSGFLVPTRDYEGRIQALQIRRDVTSREASRYLTISSVDKDCGAKGRTFPHINKGNGNMKTIILTEGPLKGDIISYYTGYPTLAVLGVHSNKYLPEVLKFLKSKGTRYINIAFDMDLYTNENVKKALSSLKQTITSIGFRFCQLDWDKNQKGLDDYLHGLNTKKEEGYR